MNCPACGYNAQKDFRFCPSCGTGLPRKNEETVNASAIEYLKCDICGEENSTSSVYCTSCGAKLSQLKVTRKAGPVQKTVKKEEKGNKQREFYGKEVKQKPDDSKKNISPFNVIILIIGLLLLGYVILDFSGIFDAPEQSQVSNVTTPGSSQINLADLERIDQLEKTVMLDTTKTDLVLELAHKLGDSGFNDRAVKYYEMYLRQNPGNADVQVDLGVVLFELKQYDKAKSRMMKGIALNPTHQIAHFNMGVVNSSEEKMDSAKIWWKKAIELNPATEIGRRAQELLNSQNIN